MGYQLGTVIAGGSALIVATALLQYFGSSLYISAYMAAVCAISFIAIWAGAETYQRDIGEEAEYRQPAPEGQPTS
jgi:hypothetical protein